ncbi:protein of unknown function [Alcaligenes faecalis subsp. faecalis]|nr:protein of unknown function [Alcaligenes faecalis subsp. faecalis]
MRRALLPLARLDSILFRSSFICNNKNVNQGCFLLILGINPMKNRRFKSYRPIQFT